MSDDLQAVNPRARLFRIILSFYGVGIYIFLFAPIAVMILLSFNSSRVVGFPDGGLHHRLVRQAVARHRDSQCAREVLVRGVLGHRALHRHRHHGGLPAGARQHQEPRRGKGFHHPADHDARPAHRCGHSRAGDQRAAHPAVAVYRHHRTDRAGDTVRHPGGVVEAGGVGPQPRARRRRSRCQRHRSESCSWCCRSSIRASSRER